MGKDKPTTIKDFSRLGFETMPRSLKNKPVLDARILTFDLETTSLDVETAVPIQATAILSRYVMRNGQRVVVEEAVWNELFDPQEELEEVVTDITGLTNEMLEGKPHFMDKDERGRTGLSKLHELMLEADMVVSYNGIGYDHLVLKHIAKRHGIDFVLKMPILDVFVWATKVRHGAKGLRLIDCARDEGVSEEGAHNAIVDVRMTQNLFWSWVGTRITAYTIYGAMKAQLDILLLKDLRREQEAHKKELRRIKTQQQKTQVGMLKDLAKTLKKIFAQSDEDDVAFALVWLYMVADKGQKEIIRNNVDEEKWGRHLSEAMSMSKRCVRGAAAIAPRVYRRRLAATLTAHLVRAASFDNWEDPDASVKLADGSVYDLSEDELGKFAVENDDGPGSLRFGVEPARPMPEMLAVFALEDSFKIF